VSGLALGIDAVAHRAALDAGGMTIAVLGCGVDDATIGPRQNVPLARDILQHDGLILSEYPSGTPADRWTFPARNRIISGLSKGVIVTEAAIKSGALITARLAADQGRDVFAVPGGIYWPRSAGPNHLISHGATIVTSAQDVLNEYGYDERSVHHAVSTRDPVQRRIAAILDDGPAHIDSIISSIALPASQVMAALSRMELTGTVVSAENGHYRIS
jgi:DNA processing protein